MKKLPLSLAFLCLTTPSALAQANYDYRVDFGLLPIGSVYLERQIRETWTDPHLSFQWTGDSGTSKIFHIVAEGTAGGRCLSGRCLEEYYPTGEVGNSWGAPTWGTREWQINAAATPVALNAEWDWLFEPGFDFHSQGKIAPRISVVDRNGAGQSLRWYWYYSAPLPNTGGNAHPVALAENLKTGAPLCSGKPSPLWDYETNVWYHFHLQFAPGPRGWLKAWIKRPVDPTEVLTMTCGPVANTSPTTGYMLSFSSFFGGAGSIVAAANDSYTLLDNIHIYTGY